MRQTTMNWARVVREDRQRYQTHKQYIFEEKIRIVTKNISYIMRL